MAEGLVVNRDWAEIPYFRKSWFMVVMFLVFMPACLFVMWTGNTYYRRQGVVYQTSRKQKLIMSLGIVMFLLSFYLRRGF